MHHHAHLFTSTVGIQLELSSLHSKHVATGAMSPAHLQWCRIFCLSFTLTGVLFAEEGTRAPQAWVTWSKVWDKQQPVFQSLSESQSFILSTHGSLGIPVQCPFPWRTVFQKDVCVHKAGGAQDAACISLQLSIRPIRREVGLDAMYHLAWVASLPSYRGGNWGSETRYNFSIDTTQGWHPFSTLPTTVPQNTWPDVNWVVVSTKPKANVFFIKLAVTKIPSLQCLPCKSQHLYSDSYNTSLSWGAQLKQLKINASGFFVLFLGFQDLLKQAPLHRPTLHKVLEPYVIT